MSDGEPTPSQVEGVESAGPDFMEAVFSLRKDEVGVAVNQPRTMVYVVRVQSETPSDAVLRDMFFSAGITNDVNKIAQREQLRVLSEWYDTIEQEMNVKWLREPQAGRDRAETRAKESAR